jgi:hypothetical protein
MLHVIAKYLAATTIEAGYDLAITSGAYLAWMPADWEAPYVAAACCPQSRRKASQAHYPPSDPQAICEE